MKFVFPILNAEGKEFSDINDFTTFINGESSGHYLLGNYQKWHGGIHISDQIAPWCRDKYPIRAMADGKVVAFRIMDNYFTSEFQGESLRYSNSFCLLEHQYCEVNPETKAKNEFAFYTLYMHLAPWAQVMKCSRLVLKKRWNVRNSVPHYRPDAEQQQADKQLAKALLPAGTELEPSTDSQPVWGTVDGKDYRFIKVRIKTSLSPREIGDGEKAGILLGPGCQVWIAEDENALERVIPALAHWIFDQIEATLTRDMVGRADPQFCSVTERWMVGGRNCTLPSGTQVKFDAHRLEFHWLDNMARKMARCEYQTPSSSELSGRCGIAWVCVEEHYISITQRTPTHLNELYVLPNPVAVAAGETIGFMGLMETPLSLLGGKQSKYQVHLELFSQDPRLNDVLENKARIVGGTCYAKIPAGLSLFEKRANQWVDSGNKSQEDLLTAPKIIQSESESWVCIKENIYVNKNEVDMLSQHDWLKIGFKTIDGSGSDGYLDPDAPSGFFKELTKGLVTDGDENLSGEEMLRLLRCQSNRGKAHRLIVKHPSEWFDKSTDDSHQWLDRLEATLASQVWGKLVKHEKQRVDKLAWIKGLNSLIIPRVVWHFWPFFLRMEDKPRNISVIKRPKNVQEFIDMALESALETSKNWNIPTSVLLAQSAHESGWGKHVKGNAYFGIKGKSPNGNSTLFNTTEVIDGKIVKVKDTFRSYANYAEAADDYGRFLNKNKRYAAAISHSNDPDAFIENVANAGYATDPEYKNKIIKIMKVYNLYEYDL